MKLVAARLGDAVDDAAGEAAVLGRGAQTADLDLLEPLDGRQDPVLAGAGIGDVHAVEGEGVLTLCGAAVGQHRAAAGLAVVDVDAPAQSG